MLHLAAQIAEKSAGAAGDRPGGEGGGQTGGHVLRAECGDKRAALAFVVRAKRQTARDHKQVEQLVDAAQVAEGIEHGRQDIGVVAPAGTAIQGHAALARALAIETGAAGKAARGQVGMDGAVMAREVGAGRARRLVYGEFRALVESQPNAAKRHTGRAIGGKLRQIGGVAVRCRAGRRSCVSGRQA